MKNHIRKAALFLSVCLAVTGCGREKETAVQHKSSADIVTGVVDYETSSLGIDSNARDFLERLTDNTYYVVHEGIYYPVYTYHKNNLASAMPGNGVDEGRMVFYTLDNYQDIPTLFPGDHLVYYSTNNMLDDITWERYIPLGISFGVYSLQRTTGGRYYVDLSGDEEIILPDSELHTLYDLGTDKITIDKIGGVVVDDDVVSDGVILGATEGTDYDVEVYTGTNYKHYNASADTYVFKAYELFSSAGTQTLQDCFWEVDIPEYFVNGYYSIDNLGMFRLLEDPCYTAETDYSKQLIFPDPDDYSQSGTKNKLIYSEIDELNGFRQETYPDELGYVDPEAEPGEEEEEVILPEAAKFKEANVKEYTLWFPEGRECTIEIRSKSGESTGSASVVFEDGDTLQIPYNRFDGVYTASVAGAGNTGLLSVSGFWYDYDITLVNAEIYDGQDKAVPAEEDTESGE